MDSESATEAQVLGGRHSLLRAEQEEREETKSWLRELREASDLRQEDVAGMLGVSLKTISNMENPKHGFPNGLTVIRYLRALGVVAASRTEPPQPAPLEALRATVDQHGQETTRALKALAKEVRALARRPEGGDPQASEGKR